MKELDACNAARLAVSRYFGYAEADGELPQYVDERDMYWRIKDEVVKYHHDRQLVEKGTGPIHFAPQSREEWIYRGQDYTLLIVDPNMDGIDVFKVFDNTKEVKP